MGKLENYEKTITTSLKVSVTAGVYVVGAEVLLNRTGMSAPAKGAAVAGVGVLGGLALAGHLPNVAAGLIVGSVVYVAQTASRSAKLEQRIDELLSEKIAASETAAAEALRNQPATPAATPATTPATTPPGQGLPRGLPTGAARRDTFVGGRQGTLVPVKQAA